MQSQTIFKPMPVRIYSTAADSVVEDRIFRLASTFVVGAADPDIAQRIKAYAEHASVRFLDEFESGNFKQLLQVLRKDMRMWDIPFQSDPEKILGIFERNPDLFSYPVGGLMGVAQNNHKLYGLLADVIESIVLLAVAQQPLDAIRQLNSQSKGMKTSATGEAKTIYTDKEWDGINVPTEELKGFAYRYLDAAIKQWALEGKELTPRGLAEFLDSNPPDSSKLPLGRKLDLVRANDGMLLWTDLSAILKGMKRDNSIKDVIDAMFDSLIKENAIYWVKNVGTRIDWNIRARQLTNTSDSGDTEPPEVGRDSPTKVIHSRG